MERQSQPPPGPGPNLLRAGIRDSLEFEIIEEFAAIGRALEDYIARVENGPIPKPQSSRLGHRLTHLAHRVYQFDLAVLELIQDRRLGSSAPPGPEHVAESERPVLEFGAQGEPVFEVQRLLARGDAGGIQVDGLFGRETEMAVKLFQRSRGLEADGVVARRTWDTLLGET